MNDQRKSSKNAPSILCKDLQVIGQITSTGDIQIDGILDGDLRSYAVTVGQDAHITGELAGETVTIRGRVDGTIRARQVHLCATCEVNGDIYHEALAIETGAHLNGTVKREKDPLKNAAVGVLLEGLQPVLPGGRILGLGALDQRLLGAACCIGRRQPEQGQIVGTFKAGA